MKIKIVLHLFSRIFQDHILKRGPAYSFRLIQKLLAPCKKWLLGHPVDASVSEDYGRMPRRVKDPSYWHPVTVPWFNINCTKRLPLIGKYEILRSRTSALSGTGSRSRVRFGLASRQDAGHIDIPRALAAHPPPPHRPFDSGKCLSG